MDSMGSSVVDNWISLHVRNRRYRIHHHVDSCRLAVGLPHHRESHGAGPNNFGVHDTKKMATPVATIKLRHYRGARQLVATRPAADLPPNRLSGIVLFGY